MVISRIGISFNYARVAFNGWHCTSLLCQGAFGRRAVAMHQGAVHKFTVDVGKPAMGSSACACVLPCVLASHKCESRSAGQQAALPLQTSYDEGQAGNVISETPEWLDLVAHVQDIEKVHLKDLLQDEGRTDELSMESDGVYADFSRQRVTSESVKVLHDPYSLL